VMLHLLLLMMLQFQLWTFEMMPPLQRVRRRIALHDLNSGARTSRETFFVLLLVSVFGFVVEAVVVAWQVLQSPLDH